MNLPLDPSLQPMLARLARELPAGPGLAFEPKWDGFRCLVFRDGDAIDMRSRNGRPLARYFPEITEALHEIAAPRFVLDAEIVVSGPGGFDFNALLQRLHPAESRVARLRAETPACLVVFDLLAVGDDALLTLPFAERRTRLETLLHAAPARTMVTPLTTDRDVARAWLERFDGGGIDGLVAKRLDAPYTPGKRTMTKVKNERTADCVVAGFRWHQDEPTVGSLLLGLYDSAARLRHVGLAASFTAARRRALLDEVRPYLTSLEGHPWEHGFGVDVGAVGRLPGAASRWADGREITWVPLRPELVCEITYDRLEGDRFRHPPRFRRWRPDRDPRSCTFEQFEETPALSLDDVVAAAGPATEARDVG